jgi:hypothetical protein
MRQVSFANVVLHPRSAFFGHSCLEVAPIWVHPGLPPTSRTATSYSCA